ncbi:MAG: RodZ domain-containing protein [Cyanobacteria bacterium P01_A01_bin.15]
MTSYSTVQKQQLSQLGAYLQEKRQEQEKSLEDISLQTYIRAQLLKALESGDTADLPQPIFVQGFIRRYADALGLDGTSFSKQFPVHSIPNTPRPVAQPATPVNMSYQTALQNPPIQTKLTKPKPAVGAFPRRSTQPQTSAASVSPIPTIAPDPATDAGAPATADAVDARDIALDQGPSESNDLALGGPGNGLQVEDSSGSLFAQEAAVTLPPDAPVGALPMEPEPAGPYLSGVSTSNTNWLPWGIGAAVMVGAIALIASIINGGSNEPPAPQTAEPPQAVVQPETAQPETTAQPEPAQPETAQPEPAATPPAEPEPDTATAGDAPVNVSVEITEAGPSWMRIVVDGNVAFEGLLDPGTQQTWEGQESISMNVGNAGAALISANGSEPTPAGNPGGAEFLTFTAEE